MTLNLVLIGIQSLLLTIQLIDLSKTCKNGKSYLNLYQSYGIALVVVVIAIIGIIFN